MGGVERWVMVNAKDQGPGVSRSHQTSLTEHSFKAMSIEKWETLLEDKALNCKCGPC